MPTVVEGNNNIQDKRFAIVVARFNEFVTKRLLDGCLKQLQDKGVQDDHIAVAWVPGAFEIPMTAAKFASKSDIDAVICLGCVIKGETYHFDTVVNESARGIASVGLAYQKPVIYEVLAVENVELANARSQSDGDNKGADAADAAIEMVTVLDQI